MEKILFDKFENYAKKFDFSNDMISRKFYHTFRVVDYAKEIAKSENLADEDYNIAVICALLHDIGRFEQARIYKTYNDKKSIDHGDLGYKILQENDFISEFVPDNNIKSLVLNVVKNHNKFAIDPSLSEKEVYFTKLIRDADKLDILDKQRTEIKDDNSIIDEKAVNFIKNHQLAIRDGQIRNDASEMVLCMSFIFDINFEKSFDIMRDNKSIDYKINVLKAHCDPIIVNEIETEIHKYL